MQIKEKSHTATWMQAFTVIFIANVLINLSSLLLVLLIQPSPEMGMITRWGVFVISVAISVGSYWLGFMNLSRMAHVTEASLKKVYIFYGISVALGLAVVMYTGGSFIAWLVGIVINSIIFFAISRRFKVRH